MKQPCIITYHAYFNNYTGLYRCFYARLSNYSTGHLLLLRKGLFRQQLGEGLLKMVAQLHTLAQTKR